MIPECMLQNIAQPQRNPAAGENISRRNTYTPPVFGYADDSSAQMLAPNQVSAPAAIHTRSMPLNDGTALLTSDGWTKIDEPTMVPTTMAVAWVRPRVRARLVDITLGRRVRATCHRAARTCRASESYHRSLQERAGRRRQPSGVQPSDEASPERCSTVAR